MWTTRIRPDGQTTWDIVHSSSLVASEVVSTFADRVLIAGRSNPGSATHDLWLGGMDASGNRTWDTNRGDSGKDEAGGVLALSDGGALVVGSATFVGGPHGGLTVGTVTRTNAWGHRTCSEAGVCRSKALTDCADSPKNGGFCTRDRCDPTLGCRNVAVPAMTCPSPDSCSLAGVCKAGVCAAGSEGKYFVKALHGVSLDELRGVHWNADGSAVMAGRSGTDIVLIRTDVFGRLVSSQKVPGVSAKSVHAAIPVSGGDVVVLYGDQGGKVIAVRLTPLLASKWSKTVCSPNAITPYNRTATPAKNLTYLTNWWPTCQVSRFISASGGKAAVVSGESQATHAYWGPSKKNHHNRATRRVIWVRGLNLESGSLGVMRQLGQSAGSTDLPFPSGWTTLSHYYKGKWHYYPPTTAPFPLSANALPLDDGSVALGGHEAVISLGSQTGLTFPNPRAYLRKLSPSGTVEWAEEFSAQGGTILTALTVAADGGVLGVGKSQNKEGTIRAWLLRTNGTGKAKWSKSFPLQGVSTFTDIVPVGDNVHVSGALALGGQSQVWHGVFQVGGGLLRVNEHSAGDGAHLALPMGGLRILKSGEALLAAAFVQKGATSPVLIRASHWGAATCADAAVCGETKLDACDDNDLCTYDFCADKSGKATCSHKPMLPLCRDDDPCTVDTCDKLTGGCAHTPNTCDDDDACTADTCDPDVDAVVKADGCLHTPVTCKDDDNSCTSNACNKAKGCDYAPTSEGQSCIDTACKTGSCGSGLCKHDGQAVLSGCRADMSSPSCAETLKARKDAPDGTYWLDWDGGFGNPAAPFYCDMKSGGWTRVELHDFDGPTTTWNNVLLAKCGALGQGARPGFVQGASYNVMSRTFAVPPHAAARATFDLTGVDWSTPRSVSLFADGGDAKHQVWSYTGDPAAADKSLCYGAIKDVRKLGAVAEFKHSAPSLTLQIRGPKADPGETIWWALIDNFSVWTR